GATPRSGNSLSPSAHARVSGHGHKGDRARWGGGARATGERKSALIRSKKARRKGAHGVSLPCSLIRTGSRSLVTSAVVAEIRPVSVAVVRRIAIAVVGRITVAVIGTIPIVQMRSR